jgi:rhodanese-related sulfurtransferase
LAVKTLDDMGLERASHIETGFKGWQADGLPVVTIEQWRADRR